MPDAPLQPLCISLIICDAVYQDPMSRKTTLLGAMAILPSVAVPFTYRPFCVHFSLTQLRGRYALRVVIKHERTGEVIFQTPAGGEVVSCDDPIGQIDGTLRIGPLKFPYEGAYRFSLLLNDEVIAQRRLDVQLPPKRGQPPSTPPGGDRTL